MIPKLMVHGGAWNIPGEQESAHLAGVKRAVEEVYPRLEKGLSALDAVEQAVRILEDDPTFDAGRGAFLNARGQIELDAMIMDGESLRFGAVGALQNILHPVSVARRVMERTEHCFLVGEGALQFAKEQGFTILSPEELLTARELEFYQKIKKDSRFTTRKPFEDEPPGTVGAVCLDKKGRLAAATSTGGTPRKLPGRIGDTPIVGAGTYADNQTGAASATGFGESIMPVLLAKTACDFTKTYPAPIAARLAVALLKKRVNGLGGVILIDRLGNYGWAFNTPKMARAYWDTENQHVVTDIS